MLGSREVIRENQMTAVRNQSLVHLIDLWLFHYVDPRFSPHKDLV